MPDLLEGMFAAQNGHPTDKLRHKGEEEQVNNSVTLLNR